MPSHRDLPLKRHASQSCTHMGVFQLTWQTRTYDVSLQAPVNERWAYSPMHLFAAVVSYIVTWPVDGICGQRLSLCTRKDVMVQHTGATRLDCITMSRGIRATEGAVSGVGEVPRTRAEGSLGIC